MDSRTQSATTATTRASGTAVTALLARDSRGVLVRAVLPVLVVAAVAWTMTVRGTGGAMGMTAVAYVAAWVLMMVAMMLPAVAPVVGLYALAARRGVVAAVPVFVAGYLLVWAVSGVPAYVVSLAVSDSLMAGEPWVARLTGVTLLAAAAYQLTPIKAMCLRHCRSPMTFFLSRRGGLSRPRAAFTAGAGHGLYCLGCCWALMAVLIVLGGMQLGWALALTVVIALEKLAPWGAAVARGSAAVAGVLGVALIASPPLLQPLIRI
ncbi:MAG TPA: DUF2182 domain-containing protein [Nocardioidaceae bacterium]|nr:DUF2182 domain-containing protein [Nocardioidaceae bacterium]